MFLRTAEKKRETARLKDKDAPPAPPTPVESEPKSATTPHAASVEPEPSEAAAIIKEEEPEPALESGANDADQVLTDEPIAAAIAEDDDNNDDDKGQDSDGPDEVGFCSTVLGGNVQLTR